MALLLQAGEIRDLETENSIKHIMNRVISEMNLSVKSAKK